MEGGETELAHDWIIADGLVTGNIVLQDTVERIFGGKLYADVPRGLFIIRGENVLLLGEVVGCITGLS